MNFDDLVGDLLQPRISTVPFLLLASFVFCRYDSELCDSGSGSLWRSPVVSRSIRIFLQISFELSSISMVCSCSGKVTPKSGKLVVWDFLDGPSNSTLNSVPELSESDTDAVHRCQNYPVTLHKNIFSQKCDTFYKQQTYNFCLEYITE